MKKFILIVSACGLLIGCANMVAPTGGEKDIDAPKLFNIIEVIEDETLLEVKFRFDEFIELNNWEENFYISPPIKKRIQKIIKGTTLTLTIDDTLAQNTTYYIALNKCIKDLNEGNVLDTLNYTFSTAEQIDSLTLIGKLKDAYTLKAIENAWVMLFDKSRNDTAIFKEEPNYVAKTDENGMFIFPNLKTTNYKIVALTDFDFIYNEGEKIAFLESSVNTKQDSFISLFAFDPIVEVDSTILLDTTNVPADSIKVNDSTEQQKSLSGNLLIKSASDFPAIFQLLQNEKVVSEFIFTQTPYHLTALNPGKYQLKYILDANSDGKWNTGNWKEKIQPEKAANYPNEITIRSKWDLELEWNLD